MRIHRLSVQAFGPFPGKETIDFEPLNEAGLFLLTGDTGAGKSTILEALCFALYGSTTVAENTKSLKSDFAAPEAAPEVELEATIGPWRYRVVRRPEWNRPSSRSKKGFVKQQAQVSLSRIPADRAEDPSAEWESVSVRIDEAGRHLQEVIGLNRAQFEQVVMLPQGRFAQFLAASSTDREALLKKLFSTETFEAVREHLKIRAQRAATEAGNAVEELRRSRQTVVRLVENVLPEDGQEQLMTRGNRLLSDAEQENAEQENAEQESRDEETTTQGIPGQKVPDEERASSENEEADDHLLPVETLPAGVLHEAAEQLVRDVVEQDRRSRSVAAEAAEQARAHRAGLNEQVRSWQRHRELEERRTRLESSAAARAERARALADAEAAAPVGDAARRDRRSREAREDRARQVREIRQEAAPCLEELDALPVEAGTEQNQTRASAEAELERAVWGRKTRGTPSADPESPGAGPEDVVRPDSERLDAYQDLLAHHGARLESWRAARTEHEQARRRADQLARDAGAAEKRLEQARQAHEQAVTAVQDLEAQALRLDERRQELAGAHETLERAVETDRLTRSLAAAQAEHGHLVQEARAAEERRRAAAQAVDELLTARFRRAVDVLAEELAPGQPCPVCGATEHPAPAADQPRDATTSGDAQSSAAPDTGTGSPTDAATDLTDEGLERALTRREEAETAAHRSTAVLNDAASRTRSLQDQGALADPEAAQQQLAEARERAEELTRLEDSACAAAERREAAEQRREASATALRERELDLGTARAAAREHATILHALEEDLAEIPEASVLEEHARVLDRLVDLDRRHRRALDGLAHAEEDQRRAAGELEQALEASPFQDVESARARALSDEDRAALTTRVRAERDEEVRLAEAWDHPEHRALLEAIEHGAQEPDDETLQDAERAATAAAARHEDAVARAARSETALTSLRGERARSLELVETSGERVRRARVLEDLSDVAAGNGAENTQSMSLTTFVLAAELEEIAQAASVRLHEMTGGRYTVRHTDAKASRGRHSGLGLEIFDAWTSEARATSTLSGGETFMTSLCLALGMADVVQARAGGVDIDTLFVDEGFGSLDETTLDTVMDAIDGLRENGRVIGLVSHVADMKSRIPQHVRVRRSATGSVVESRSA